MLFNPVVAETRFGFGLSPEVAAPQSVDQMMRQLRGSDDMAARFVIPETVDLHSAMIDYRALRQQLKLAQRQETTKEAARQDLKDFARQSRRSAAHWIGQDVSRRVWASDGLRERLVAFWADHFSAPGKNSIFRLGAAAYVETAIRPHVAARFEDLLTAAVLHPQMLHFLDQQSSVGPNSDYAADHNRSRRGLNENLAREILELHTLGVTADYGQQDVRQLAELLTGVTIGPDLETRFVAKKAEPGAEVVLGKSYGQDAAEFEDVLQVLRDLAKRKETAQHLSRKLAVHFVSDRPDPELVAAMQASYLASDGDLAQVVETMLRHPAAWQQGSANFKHPATFVSSALRALAVPADRLSDMARPQMNRLILTPLRLMGQPWGRPLGPDGFAEADAHWVTPQGMAARLQWALAAPMALSGALPDPRGFVAAALGPAAPQEVVFAARAAESRREGIALVLMSPAFQRQ